MSRRIAEIIARREEMYPYDWLQFDPWRSGTEDEELAWARYGLSHEARRVAKYSADESPAQAMRCYGAIARSLA